MISKEVNGAIESVGGIHIRSSPSHPQTNGQVERGNGSFKDILAKLNA